MSLRRRMIDSLRSFRTKSLWCVVDSSTLSQTLGHACAVKSFYVVGDVRLKERVFLLQFGRFDWWSILSVVLRFFVRRSNILKVLFSCNSSSFRTHQSHRAPGLLNSKSHIQTIVFLYFEHIIIDLRDWSVSQSEGRFFCHCWLDRISYRVTHITARRNFHWVCCTRPSSIGHRSSAFARIPGMSHVRIGH